MSLAGSINAASSDFAGLEFVFNGQLRPGHIMVRTDTFGAVRYSRYTLGSIIFECNLMVNGRSEYEVVAEVKVG